MPSPAPFSLATLDDPVSAADVITFGTIAAFYGLDGTWVTGDASYRMVLYWLANELDLAVIDRQSGNLDYGLMPVSLTVANVTDSFHAFLASQADVTDVPLNIDNQISAGALSQVQDALETLKIPGTWVTTAHTYRQILRAVAGLFQFAGKYHEMHNEPLVDAGVNLSLTWAQVPPAKKAKIIATADFFQIDYSPVTNTWTLRQILKLLADWWQASTFQFGFTLL